MNFGRTVSQGRPKGVAAATRSESGAPLTAVLHHGQERTNAHKTSPGRALFRSFAFGDRTGFAPVVCFWRPDGLCCAAAHPARTKACSFHPLAPVRPAYPTDGLYRVGGAHRPGRAAFVPIRFLLTDRTGFAFGARVSGDWSLVPGAPRNGLCFGVPVKRRTA
jgi:hypothetical protein